MKLIRFTLTLAVVAAVAAGTHAADRPASPRWLWPVPLDPAIASNFCEYRDGRFHAGLDVRTYGREGVPCLAIGNGWISRVRAGSRGYGKGLHLTLDDGMQVVYGHLSEFAPALEDTVYALQMKDTTYTVDARMPPGRFRVSAGDTIAYSGMTGTTAPHLHLEIRDAGDRPVDPLQTDLAMVDRIPPSISRVVFVPLTAAARVQGRCLPWSASIRRGGDGRYLLPDTLHIRGRVGVAATVTDRVNAESGRLAPHALEVDADDVRRARIEFRRFAFDRGWEVDRLYHAGLLRAREEELFQIWNTGTSPFDTAWVDGGALPGDSTRVHHGRVRAWDAAGNSTDVEFVFVCGATRPHGKEKADERRDLTVELDGAFFQDGFAVIPARVGTGDGAHDGRGVVIAAQQLGASVEPMAGYADHDSAALWLAGLLRDRDRTLRFASFGLRLDVPASALPSDVVVYARGADAFRRGVDGLKLLSRPVRIGPVGWVLHGPMTVHVDFPHPQANDAIYRYDDYRRSWSILPSTAEPAGWVAKSDRPGVFAVFRDVEAPSLGKPYLARGRSWATGRPMREIRIPMDDAGSGFDEAKSEVRVGGVRHIFRWDFVGKKLIVPLRGDSIIGKQSVRVVALDRSGNRSSRSAVVDTGTP